MRTKINGLLGAGFLLFALSGCATGTGDAHLSASGAGSPSPPPTPQRPTALLILPDDPLHSIRFLSELPH